MDDVSLVQRWCDGEEDAFYLLYSRYWRRVFSTAYRFVRDSEEARDATQEIFLKVYRALPNWNPDRASLSTWLFRMAANHSIDCWRSKKRRLQSEMPAERLESEGWLSPQRLLEAKEAVGLVKRCVAELPDLQRRFVVLRYFRECSLEEIAVLEDRSLGTVKGLLYRATRSIRRGMVRHRPRVK